MRPNTLKWDSREQDLRIDVAERQFLETREDVATAATNAFFDVYSAKLSLKNAEGNVAINDTLYTLNKGRFEVGKISENDLLQSELALLNARTAVDGARLAYERALAALRLLINLPVGGSVDVTVTADVPQFEADTAIAEQQARKNRSTMTDLELQDLQAKRRVNEARLNSGIGATVSAAYGRNATGVDMNSAYQDLLSAQRLSLSVQMPLVQWGARSADIQAAQADQERITSTTRVAREQAMQDAHFAALQLSLSRRQLLLSAKADTVAQKRYEVAYNRFVVGRIGIDVLFLAQNDKDQALNAFTQGLRGFWLSYYRLRRLTLFDFATGTAIR
jgi:outer membrane protein TolC